MGKLRLVQSAWCLVLGACAALCCVTAMAGVEKVGDIQAAVKGAQLVAQGIEVKTNGQKRVEWRQDRVNAAVTNEIAEFKSDARLAVSDPVVFAEKTVTNAVETVKDNIKFGFGVLKKAKDKVGEKLTK